MVPGPTPRFRDGRPRSVAQVGTRIFFPAETKELGRELRAVDVSEPPSPPPPFDTWIESPQVPGFRLQDRAGFSP